jgi:hypothetical protein
MGNNKSKKPEVRSTSYLKVLAEQAREQRNRHQKTHSA